MPRTMSRFAQPLLAAALLSLSLASCGGSDLLNVSHSWGLQSVGNVALPFTVPNSAHNVVINSALAELDGDNTYTMTFTGTTDGVAGQVGSDHGHWAINSSEFTFQSSDFDGDYIAALSSGTFRASVPGHIVGSTDANFDMLFEVIQ